MFKSFLPSFSHELSKIAARQDHAEVAHSILKEEPKQRDWKLFEKKVKSKGFREAVLAHPEADAKLRRYTKALGSYKDSKEVVGMVPSRSTGKLHTVKKMASGRLGCDCKDWQYIHSHRNSDCSHIKELSGGMEKVSIEIHPLTYVGAGVSMAHMIHKANKEYTKGKTMEENVKRLHLGMPLAPVHR